MSKTPEVNDDAGKNRAVGDWRDISIMLTRTQIIEILKRLTADHGLKAMLIGAVRRYLKTSDDRKYLIPLLANRA